MKTPRRIGRRGIIARSQVGPMGDTPLPHPRFDHPPVVETILSIEFAPLFDWQIPTFGLYWESIRDRYPRTEVHPPLPSQIEDMGRPAPFGELSLKLSPIPEVRCWFYNDKGTELIQVQNNRFIFNWKRGLIDQAYPHYENIRPVVAREWDHFCGFAAPDDPRRCEVKQCEIAYINHIELGAGWKDYGELGLVLAPWSGRTSKGFLPEPEDVEVAARYRLPGGRGRLHVRAQPAIRNSDHKEILQLTLIGRGRPSSPEPSRVFEWFDSVQPWVSNSFVDFTADPMHSRWGMRIDHE